MIKAVEENRLSIIIITVTFSFAFLGLYYAFYHIPISSANTVSKQVTCDVYSTEFTIIASQEGFNGSINHNVPKNYWPVMCVKQGTLVTINVVNTDNVQPHGFSLKHYFEGGISLMPGVYSYHCTFHPFWMIGKIIVKG
jgi:hypothetical protein